MFRLLRSFELVLAASLVFAAPASGSTRERTILVVRETSTSLQAEQ